MKTKKSIKVRKKHWYKVLAPKLFNNREIGESCVYDQRELLGRVLTINLMNISNDPKTQHINISFKITELKGDKVTTEVIGFTVINSAIKRLVRRGCTRIDNTVICETADDKKLKIKSLLLTKAYVKSSKRSSLQKLLIESIVSSVKKQTYDQFIESLLTFKFKRSLKTELGKIYPLRACETRKVVFATEKEATQKMIKPKKVEKPKNADTEKSDSKEENVPEKKIEEK